MRRARWGGICNVHADALAKVSPLHPEPAAQLKSRKAAYQLKEVALRQCDAALAAERGKTKELEAAIARKTLPVRAKDDLVGALEVRIRAEGLASLVGELWQGDEGSARAA